MKELLWPAQPRARVERVLLGLACFLLAIALYQIARRVVFPWDLYIWSESPFMTNMLKITSGESAFDKPEDANSWVYAPGVEYLCFAILRPLGLSLDVRACRVIVVGLGLLAAWAAMRSSTRLYRLLAGRAEAPPTYRVFAFVTMTLLIFRNFTSDVCHPDNAYAAHAMITLLLCVRAFEKPTLKRALIAAAFSGCGIVFKQTAAAGIVGVATLFFVVGHGRWSLGARIATVATGGAVAGASLFALRSHPHSKFFLFDLLSRHAVMPSRAVELLRVGNAYPHLTLLFLMTCFAVMRVVGHEEAPATPKPRFGTSTFLVVWAALATETLLSLASYVKVMGAWNNFGIICLWATVLVLPVMFHLLEDRAAAKAHGGMALVAGALAALLLCLVPLKAPPTPKQYAYGERLEAHLRDDLAAGRRPLLPHGTLPLLRAGARSIPLDRSNSVLELNSGELGELAGTRARLEGHHYDRIYMLAADFYGGAINEAITQNFHEIEVLPGDETQPHDDYLTGYQNFMRVPVRVMEWGPPPRK